MTKKLAQGRKRTIPNHLAIFPALLIRCCRAAGSIRHQEMPATMTTSATTPPTIFPPTVLRNSINLLPSDFCLLTSDFLHELYMRSTGRGVINRTHSYLL